MKIRSKFINYSLQEELIEVVASKNIPHRVKADRTLETAHKWEDTIYDCCVDIIHDLFEHPALQNNVLNESYRVYIKGLAEHNIPFFTFIINEKYTVATSTSDTTYICDHIKKSYGLAFKQNHQNANK